MTISFFKFLFFEQDQRMAFNIGLIVTKVSDHFEHLFRQAAKIIYRNAFILKAPK